MECRGSWVYKHAVGGERPTHTVQYHENTYTGGGMRCLARRGSVLPHERACASSPIARTSAPGR
eukprot:7893450-Lingulodinium_polyedra.AAC.1